MTEKQFLRAAIDEYFSTGKKFYQGHGRVVLVDFNSITRYKELPDERISEFEEMGLCPE